MRKFKELSFFLKKLSFDLCDIIFEDRLGLSLRWKDILKPGGIPSLIFKFSADKRVIFLEIIWSSFQTHWFKWFSFISKCNFEVCFLFWFISSWFFRGNVSWRFFSVLRIIINWFSRSSMLLSYKTFSFCSIVKLFKLSVSFLYASRFMISKMNLINMTTGDNHSFGFISVSVICLISSRFRSRIMWMYILILIVATFRSGNAITRGMRRIFASKL